MCTPRGSPRHPPLTRHQRKHAGSPTSARHVDRNRRSTGKVTHHDEQIHASDDSQGETTIWRPESRQQHDRKAPAWAGSPSTKRTQYPPANVRAGFIGGRLGCGKVVRLGSSARPSRSSRTCWAIRRPHRRPRARCKRSRRSSCCRQLCSEGAFEVHAEVVPEAVAEQAFAVHLVHGHTWGDPHPPRGAHDVTVVGEAPERLDAVLAE